MASEKQSTLVQEILKFKDPKVLIFTSFTLDLMFFEREILPELESDTRILILADKHGYDSSINFFSSLKYAGQRYRVVRVDGGSYVFHPKVTLIASSNEVRILVGSGNLTKSGVNKNLEVLGTLVVGADDPISIDLRADLENLLDDLDKAANDEVVKEFLDMVSAATPKASNDNGTLRLISSISSSLIKQVNLEGVTGLEFISPYCDRKFLDRFEGYKKYETSSEEFDRFNHAKIFKFKNNNEDTLVVGSANATQAAWEGEFLEGTGNAEVSMVLKGEESLKQYDQLISSYKFVQVEPDFEYNQDKEESFEGLPIRLARAEMKNSSIEIFFSKPPGQLDCMVEVGSEGFETSFINISLDGKENFLLHDSAIRSLSGLVRIRLVNGDCVGLSNWVIVNSQSAQFMTSKKLEKLDLLKRLNGGWLGDPEMNSIMEILDESLDESGWYGADKNSKGENGAPKESATSEDTESEYVEPTEIVRFVKVSPGFTSKISKKEKDLAYKWTLLEQILFPGQEEESGLESEDWDPFSGDTEGGAEPSTTQQTQEITEKQTSVLSKYWGKCYGYLQDLEDYSEENWSTDGEKTWLSICVLGSIFMKMEAYGVNDVPVYVSMRTIFEKECSKNHSDWSIPESGLIIYLYFLYKAVDKYSQKLIPISGKIYSDAMNPDGDISYVEKALADKTGISTEAAAQFLRSLADLNKKDALDDELFSILKIVHQNGKLKGFKNPLELENSVKISIVSAQFKDLSKAVMATSNNMPSVQCVDPMNTSHCPSCNRSLRPQVRNNLLSKPKDPVQCESCRCFLIGSYYE